jgi:putative two-component system response regulator
MMLRPECDSATVLVADDVIAYRELLATMLRGAGYRVLVAQDGQEALQLVDTEHIDLALLDVKMPRYSGYAVCQRIKFDSATRLMPVILLTGLDTLHDRVEGIECGADDFISKPVHREELLARVRSLLKLKEFTDELDNAATVLSVLARNIEEKDPDKQGHGDRLSKYCSGLAQRLALPDEHRIALDRALIVHDIGKIAVPEHILLRRGSITPEERKLVQAHCDTGERICSPLKSLRDLLPLIRHHHEHLDGSGYPDGIGGDDLPVTVRILSVVDVYDALTTDRPFRRALPIPEAFAHLKAEVESGWWDGRIVDELEALIRGGPSEQRASYRAACEAS